MTHATRCNCQFFLNSSWAPLKLSPASGPDTGKWQAKYRVFSLRFGLTLGHGPAHIIASYVESTVHWPCCCCWCVIWLGAHVWGPQSIVSQITILFWIEVSICKLQRRIIPHKVHVCTNCKILFTRFIWIPLQKFGFSNGMIPGKIRRHHLAQVAYKTLVLTIRLAYSYRI